MRCPMCVQPELQPSHRHGIEIDVCPQCKGIWLDRGELEKVLDRLDDQLGVAPTAAEQRPAAPLPPPPPSWADAPGPSPQHESSGDDRRRDDRRRDDRDRARGGKKGKRKKRSSFLGELLEELEIFD